MRSILYSSDGGDYYDQEEADGYKERSKKKVKKDAIQLDGVLNELVRVPTSVRKEKDKMNMSTSDIAEPFQETVGHNSSIMSMYAAALADEAEISSKKQRKTQVPKSKLLGMAEAKRNLLKSQFKLGDFEDGNLDEMVIMGTNVLEKEIDHAKMIPSNMRVLVRKDSSLKEL